MMARFIFEPLSDPETGLSGGSLCLEGYLGGSSALERISSTRSLCRIRIRQELRHPNEAVAAQGERRHETCIAVATHPHLAQCAPVLTPAEDLLDALAKSLTGEVARMARGARIDRSTPAASEMLGHMRGDAQAATVRDEVAGVIALVPSYRATHSRTLALEHRERRGALGKTACLGDLDIDGKTVSMLHQDMRHVAQFCRLALALLEQLRLRLVWGNMGLVRAPLAVKVHVRVPARGRGVILPVAPAHALDGRPRLDQRSIDAEVFRGEQSLAPGASSDAPQELPCYSRLDQPVAVLGEGRVIPDPIIHREADEPAEQQVVVELLTQQPLRADRVKHLQHQRAHQALRSHRLTAPFRVHAIKVPAHCSQGLVEKCSDPSQRMLRRHSLLDRDIAEQPRLFYIRSAHLLRPSIHPMGPTVPHMWRFSTAC